MNTGNNLLFFGWGLILSGIIVSGVLSESTLRAAEPTFLGAKDEELRAGSLGLLPVLLTNQSRVPAFGVEVGVELLPAGQVLLPEGEGSMTSGRTYELRLAPAAHKRCAVPVRPQERGRYVVATLRTATRAPFGFFEKERIVSAPRGEPSAPRPEVVVLPARVDTTAIAKALFARLGEVPASVAGVGDELFSLRPFRTGDDPRRIAWRRTARTGRMVVREMEATTSREIVVDLVLGELHDAAEDAIATAGSLVEDLLAAGHQVGVRGPGLLVRPGRGSRQRLACLQALATWPAERAAVIPALAGAAIISVIAQDALAPDDGDVVVAAQPRRAMSAGAA